LKLEIIRHLNDTFLRLLRGTFAIAFCPIKSLLNLRNKTSQAWWQSKRGRLCMIKWSCESSAV
jgi:hypothetical protein